MPQPIMVTGYCRFRQRPRGEVAAQLPQLGLTAFGNTHQRARARLRLLMGNLLQQHRTAGTLEDFLELNCWHNGGDSYRLASTAGPTAPETHPARRMLQKDLEGWPIVETTLQERRVTAGA